jgi:hypothetical protein
VYNQNNTYPFVKMHCSWRINDTVALKKKKNYHRLDNGAGYKGGSAFKRNKHGSGSRA